MKNKIVLLMVLTLIFIGSFGEATANSKFPVTINDYEISVLAAPVVMNGKKVDKNTRSFVYNDRTLVHIRFLEQYTDAKVSWENKTKTATIDYKGNKFELSIDYGVASVNGETKVLDKGSIPRLAKFKGETDSKTMVPLSFLAEAMGFEVGWDYKNKNAFINTKPVAKPVENPDVGKAPESNGTNKILDIKKEIVNKREAIVIYGTKDVKWNTMKFEDPARMVIDLMDSTIQNSTNEEYNYEVDFIKGVRVSQFSPDKNYKSDDKIVRLVFDLKDGISNFDITIIRNENKIIIYPIKVIGENTGTFKGTSIGNNAFDIPNNFIPKDKLIVLDPGHGGAQPGAISPNGIQEKDVNLEISLKVEKALKNAGYNVLMTRHEDIAVGPYERTSFANRNQAAIFLSIHANSSESSTLVNGVEVLYAPAPRGSFKEKGQNLITESILDEVVKSTGAKRRDIFERPNLVVLRETKMPALLIEVGFLSNLEEEILIASNDYQNKIVQGILKGINRYFSI